ncbi:MAG: hypothetical protein SAL07_00180 [Oscillatoria sp. PMC 1051.18]|nr:hypothetical protein [Oscillatoria sp. PMC 1050.18]MEC5028303.1 hypothetical protein [Oscillatoria sp. PMC 1051.18]
MSNSKQPRFWDLFLALRNAGMLLTLEDYDLLQQAIAKGYNLDNRDNLKRICRLLWVKPSKNYSAATFETVFSRYFPPQQSQSQPETTSTPETPPTAETTPTPETPPTPEKPPTGTPSPDVLGQPEIPIGVQTTSPTTSREKREFRLIPTQFPVTPNQLEKACRAFHRSRSKSSRLEIDLDATIDRIQREGIFSDIVLRPTRIGKSELLVLIDDNNGMIPYQPMLRPLIATLQRDRLIFSRFYRFTNYPDDYLFSWGQPSSVETINSLLPKLHRDRTTVLIFSDAGAATRSYNYQHINGINKFLTRLRPNIRQWLWINPLPSYRWEQTSADAIALLPGGKMISLCDGLESINLSPSPSPTRSYGVHTSRIFTSK